MAQLTSIKMSKFDNQPWGFRLQGGIDFASPLTVQKVSRRRRVVILSIYLAKYRLLILYVSNRNESTTCDNQNGRPV